MKHSHEALSPDQLYSHCTFGDAEFETTADLEPLEDILGQERAMGALEFGIGIVQPGFNLYVLGPTGVGKRHTVSDYLKAQAQRRPAPHDWCYVHNFATPHKPLAIDLEQGRARVFRQDMQQLVDDLRVAIPTAFEAEEYQTKVEEIEASFKQTLQEAFEELSRDAEQHQITLLRTPHGFALAPSKDDKVLSPEDFDKLPKEEQQRLQDEISRLEEKLSSILRQQSQWQREARTQVKELNREIVMFAAGHFIDDLKSKYADHEKICNYLDEVLSDVIEHAHAFRREEDRAEPQAMEGEDQDIFLRYKVNVLIDNRKHDGAPVIHEDTPSFNNLIGKIEHKSQFGALITNFTLIKPGALHRANGGYLVVDVYKLLQEPFAWQGLKRALTSQEIRIQSLADIYSVVSTVSLEPEPIPLNVKVILLGERLLYYLLFAHDPEFKRLFKVAADFEDSLPRSVENDLLYARLIASLAARNQLKSFDREGVARVIEHSARLVSDKKKRSLHLMDITDLLAEADYWAEQAGHRIIGREDVQRAIDAQVHRNDRAQQRFHEAILRETIMVDTEGAVVGQLNALTVIELADFAFGQPARITATARLGEGEVIDIEREVELGGAIHSKGVFILSAFLGARYAAHRPLSLSATLVFEQSYGMIEGDSASMAELCALLSTLSGLPIKQSLAITGSVDQHGKAQTIGAVNEKIQGFFQVCRERGLSGAQGVLIPRSNIEQLMLDNEVIEACRDNRFHVYAYEDVDEAIELLTGVEAGVPDENGEYPRQSVNGRVERRLVELETYREEYSRARRDREEADKTQ